MFCSYAGGRWLGVSSYQKRRENDCFRGVLLFPIFCAFNDGWSKIQIFITLRPKQRLGLPDLRPVGEKMGAPRYPNHSAARNEEAFPEKQPCSANAPQNQRANLEQSPAGVSTFTRDPLERIATYAAAGWNCICIFRCICSAHLHNKTVGNGRTCGKRLKRRLRPGETALLGSL